MKEFPNVFTIFCTVGLLLKIIENISFYGKLNFGRFIFRKTAPFFQINLISSGPSQLLKDNFKLHLI